MRSLYVINDIKEGDKFTDKNIGIIRPGTGGPTTLFDELLGKKSPRCFNKGMPLTMQSLLNTEDGVD